MDTFPWGSWAIEDGSLKTVPGEKGIDIISTETFKDFELELDWKLQSGGNIVFIRHALAPGSGCLLYTSPSPRDGLLSRMPSSA